LKGNPLTPALAKIVGPCLTTKDCQNAARATVKFFAEMQETIDEDRKRAQSDEAERQETEKENEKEEKEPTETVKEKAKGKPKKEKKNVSPRVEAPVANEVQNSNDGPNQPAQQVKQAKPSSNKRRVSYCKLCIVLLVSWLILSLWFLYMLVLFPEIAERMIDMLPGSYQAIAYYHWEKIRELISNYLNIQRIE